jgi:hypothetical protein
MSGKLTPIQTRYKGYRFRSRLEARWAVFFDLLGIAWEYEPEGFRMGSVCYLPDFRLSLPVKWLVPGLLPRLESVAAEQVWLEVKPLNKELSGGEILKIREFARATAGKSVYVLAAGDPMEQTARNFQLSGATLQLCGAAFDKGKMACLVLHPLSRAYKPSRKVEKVMAEARGWRFGK